MREIKIGKNDAGTRVDRFLMKYLSVPSSFIFKSLRKKDVRLNGKHPKGDVILKEGDILTLYMKEEVFGEKTFRPGNDGIHVVYEDAHILLINKPAELPCQPDEKHKTDTLIDRVKSYLYNRKEYRPEEEHTFAPALCNRIDTNTSGLVIAAKDAESLRMMNEKIRDREVHKYYLARVVGVPQKETATLTGKIQKNEKENRSRMAEEGKEVSLTYRTLSVEGGNALLEIELHTGRSHQIRTQMADLGHPLAGDKKYGGGMGGQALCAYKLTFQFKGEAGVLSYLSGKTFLVDTVPFLTTDEYKAVKES